MPVCLFLMYASWLLSQIVLEEYVLAFVVNIMLNHM